MIASVDEQRRFLLHHAGMDDGLDQGVDDRDVDQGVDDQREGEDKEREASDEAMQAVVRTCAGLPLALAIAGAIVREVGLSWEELREEMAGDIRETMVLEHSGSFDYQYDGLFSAMDAGMKRLDRLVRQRYEYFAAFPEDVWITEDVLMAVWKLGKLPSRRTLKELGGGSLLSMTDHAAMPHDLQRNYLQRVISAGRQADMHATVLSSIPGSPHGPPPYTSQSVSQYILHPHPTTLHHARYTLRPNPQSRRTLETVA